MRIFESYHGYSFTELKFVDKLTTYDVLVIALTGKLNIN